MPFNVNSNDGFRPIVRNGQDLMMISLYDQLCLMKNLRKAHKKARKGKGAEQYVMGFEADLEKNLLQLQKELRKQTYEPKPMKTFIIHDPKTRVISASAFRDRIVHHALFNIIGPVFERIFIYDSYAGRKEKGAHSAVKRFDEFMRKVGCNGRLLKGAKGNNMIIGYVLKADVKHYFDTINIKILLSIFQKKIKDERTLWLIQCILKNHAIESGRGMPIGSLVSQMCGNIYLNELDYFVKHELRARHYIRYMDDFVILHRDKQILEIWKNEIGEFLLTKLKLALHPDKCKIYPLHKGVNFLGFRIFYNHKLLKKSNIRRIEHRADDFAELYKNHAVTKIKIYASLEGWEASYAMHANTYKIRRNLYKRLKKQLKKADY